MTTAQNGVPAVTLVPKQGRIATLEAEVAALRGDVDRLKRVTASLMMSNPQIQAKLQDMLIGQIDQLGDTGLP